MAESKVISMRMPVTPTYKRDILPILMSYYGVCNVCCRLFLIFLSKVAFGRVANEQKELSLPGQLTFCSIDLAWTAKNKMAIELRTFLTTIHILFTQFVSLPF